METAINFSSENIAGDTMFEDQQSSFNLQNLSYPKPEDEDDKGDDDEEINDDSTDDNPPIDPDVNQAPVILQPTPKPKDK